MKKIIGIVMVLLMSVTGALAGNAKDTQTGGEKVKVIIGYADKPNQADEDVIRGNGGKTKYTYHIINAKAVEIPEQAIDRIKKNPRVAYVEEDAKVYALDAELNNSWGVKHIGAGVVHDGGNRGAGIKVAIIDTGIDYNHSDLDGNYKGGYDFVNNDNDPMDDAGHGTHCAGIVAAEDNSAGVVGVAPEAYLYGVKVLDSGGNGYWSDVIAGIDWSVQNGMDIISMSLGGGSSASLWVACDAAHNAGIVVVAAAGNNGNPSGMGDNVIYPAAYSSVIAVAATESDDERAWWSSTGPDVELAAPGVSIYSTVPGGYSTKSGTSMACPHVAGTAALVIVAGITDGNNNGRINDEVRARLTETAEDLGELGKDNLYGYGLVNANEPPVAYGQSVTTPENTSVDVTLSATDVDGDLLTYSIVDIPSKGNVTLSGNTATYTPDTNYNGADSFTFKANDGTVDSNNATVSITVTPATSTTMHVASIDMSLKIAGPNRNAIALVKIVDGGGAPVEGATVSGLWSGATTDDSDSGLTGASGEVSLKSNKVKNAPGGTNFTFTIDSVSLAGWDYDQAANVETSNYITVP